MNAKTRSRNLLHALLLAEQKERELPSNEDEPECSRNLVMSQQAEMPALEEHLRELRASDAGVTEPR